MHEVRTIIVVGAGTLQVPLIQTARDMGLSVIAFDMQADAPGMSLANHSILMSTRDIDGCVREARKLKEAGQRVHGVITAGTDASRAVAAIANALGLPGIRYADAEAATNKVLMRKRLQKHGVPVPAFRSVWSIKEAREAMDELPFPQVLKPADNMGARGVIKVERREEMYAAFRHAKRYSSTGEMILEEYMAGPELSVDALVWNDGQDFAITGIADRLIEREPYFIEIGHNMPSSANPNVLREATRVMRDAMQALGIRNGAGKGDLKITQDGIKVGEIAARLSGGYMSSHTFPYHSGINLHAAAIRIAMGDEPGDLEPTKQRVVIERGILGPAGKIVSLHGVAQAQECQGVRLVDITRNVGDTIPATTSNTDKVGHIIVEAETLAEAEALYVQAREKIELVVDESFSVDWKRVEENARARFGDQVCWVCKVCDGANCASGVPGMGGVGTMGSFKENHRALARIQIVPRYIRDNVEVDASIELFGQRFSFPIMGAPMTGAGTNLGGSIGEREFAETLLHAFRENGSVAWLGDGAGPEKFPMIEAALRSHEGYGVLICKPRADTDEIVRRFRIAQDLGIIAVGIDIDALSFRTMVLRKQSTKARTANELRRLRESTTLPFVLKGVMSREDARAAIDAGVSAIVVSNHGGRVADAMPGTASVLPAIANEVGGEIPVLVDGGIRSGNDAFKMIALGADAVLVGRMTAIAAVGGGTPAVRYLLDQYRSELARAMHLCGTASLDQINESFLYNEPETRAERR